VKREITANMSRSGEESSKELTSGKLDLAYILAV
jgi:hypothetical protein